MITGPLTIIRRSRGKYHVLDTNGNDMAGGYKSKYDAKRVVTEYKLQDKALSNVKVLKAAACITGYKGDAVINWLYQVLIRLSIQEMRLIIAKPRQLKTVHDNYISRIEKSLKQ